MLFVWCYCYDGPLFLARKNEKGDRSIRLTLIEGRCTSRQQVQTTSGKVIHQSRFASYVGLLGANISPGIAWPAARSAALWVWLWCLSLGVVYQVANEHEASFLGPNFLSLHNPLACAARALVGHWDATQSQELSKRAARRAKGYIDIGFLARSKPSLIHYHNPRGLTRLYPTCFNAFSLKTLTRGPWKEKLNKIKWFTLSLPDVSPEGLTTSDNVKPA